MNANDQSMLLPEGTDDDSQELTHYMRTCAFCNMRWESLRCPHNGYQNPCPNCGHRQAVLKNECNCEADC